MLAVTEEDVVKNEHKEHVSNFVTKVNGIREILSRDRMKVAFFGR